MDDILSQSIAYAPNKIDTETKARSLVQGPRNMYNQGQLVSPSVDGSRPGYNGDRITVHLVNETGNPNHSGIYKTTNTKTGSVSYRGGFTRRGGGGRQSTKSS